jgi:hypothetical protein
LKFKIGNVFEDNGSLSIVDCQIKYIEPPALARFERKKIWFIFT